MRFKLLVGVLSLLTLTVLAGCGQSRPPNDDEKVIFVEENEPETSGDSMMEKDEDEVMEDDSMEDDAMMEAETMEEEAEEEPAMEEAAVKEFTVEGSSFKFEPSVMRVKEGDTVRVTFKNVGGTHDFVQTEFGARTSVIRSGAEETIEFVADKKGEFPYYCSVGDHRAMGMEGTLIVE